MADSSISALPTGTPSGADYIPIVQWGVNKKATISSLPAGASNLTIGTSTISGGTSWRILYDNAWVVWELPTSGASSVVIRDTNQNIVSNNMNEGYQTIASAWSTTTLTVTSPYHTFITGVTTQIVVLPAANTLNIGWQFRIHSNTSWVVTIQTNGGATIWTLAASTDVVVTVTDISTSAWVWDVQYLSVVAATGKKVSVSNSINIAGTDSTTMTFPSTNATIARTDSAQTFTGVQTMTKPVFNWTVQNVITIAATVWGTTTLDLSTSNCFIVTLGGNTTIAISNATVGQHFWIKYVQDATWSRTVTQFTTIKWPGGTAPTLTTTANKYDWMGHTCTSAGNYDGVIIWQNI